LDYLTGSYFCFATLSTIGFGSVVRSYSPGGANVHLICMIGSVSRLSPIQADHPSAWLLLYIAPVCPTNTNEQTHRLLSVRHL